MFNQQNLTILCLSVIVIVLYIILTTSRYQGSYSLMDFEQPSRFTTRIGNYNKLFQEKINYIRQQRSLTSPANEDILKQFEIISQSPNFGIIESSVMTGMLPGATIGYTPMLPYNYTDVNKKVCFQLEQGTAGWYWLLASFPKTNSSLLIDLMRVDLLPTELRNKLGYTLGNTTIYSMTVGISHDGNYYSGTFIFEGTFTLLQNHLNFTITSNSSSVSEGNYSFQHSNDSNNANANSNVITVTIQNMILTSKTGEKKVFDLNTVCTSLLPMNLNQQHGCDPCMLNSSYQSYTNMTSSCTFTMNRTSPIFLGNDGIGWCDHQWGGGDNLTLFRQSVMTILEKGHISTGFPPYIWLAIQMANTDTQYMIFSLFETPPKLGDEIQCTYNTYKKSETIFGGSIKVKIIETVMYDGAEYPTKYRINSLDGNGNDYILDSSPYGNELIFIDQSGNNHWLSAANVLSNGNIIGNAFMEAQRFDPIEKTLEKSFALMGAKNPQQIAIQYNNTINTATLVYSWIILLLLVVCLIALLFKIFVRVIVDNKVIS